MEVVNPCAALLSNHEVLTLLRELESDHLLRTKTAFRVKKEEEAAATTTTTNSTLAGSNPHLEASENLRTIEVEAIGYLSADYLPTSSQTKEGITELVKSLATYDLTKSEKLQVVNLAPSLPVELYVIVEELEDRFGEQLDEMLGLVQSSLTTSDSNAAKVNGITGGTTASQAVIVQDNQQWLDEDADAVYEEDMFDDTGEGNGVEGDLDMEED
ncbi:RNA polymerase Rpb4-domain-containing protein [Crassisporium funariophilum]|nr:RNA polymerase Rpb4-domain-containing protein [Crassisporium funariophilum]